MEVAGKKKKIVCVRNNPCAALRAAPPLTQGRLRSAPPDIEMNFPAAGAYGMPPYGVRFVSEKRATIGRPYDMYTFIP